MLFRSEERPDIIGYVTDRARVFVSGIEATTSPEPDLAVYAEYFADWREAEPFIVGEVMRGTDIDKDLFRNVDLYLRVPTIREYWVIDIRKQSRRPTLWVYRRARDGWDIQEFPPDVVYETPLLPGLKLSLSPPARPVIKQRRTKR